VSVQLPIAKARRGILICSPKRRSPRHPLGLRAFGRPYR